MEKIKISKLSDEFDVYYTKTKEDWLDGIIEFDTTYNTYDEAVERAKILGKDNYLVEINIVDEYSTMIVVSENYKIVIEESENRLLKNKRKKQRV